jgi:hypothetical protein
MSIKLKISLTTFIPIIILGVFVAINYFIINTTQNIENNISYRHTMIEK